MPITLEENTATFVGVCAIEEAEPLLDWLQGHPGGTIDLAGCEHLHTALFQLLCRYRPTLAALPADPFLRERLLPFITPPAPAGIHGSNQTPGSENQP